jgi:hypothetical protein
MNKEQQIYSLSCHQIVAMIKKGKWVEELKQEWFRRWKLEFPYYKGVDGIKEG